MFLYYIGKYTKKKRNNSIDLRNINDGDKSFREQLEDNFELEDKKYKMKYYDVESEDKVEKEIDITYKNLPKNIKRKVDYTTITVIEISIDNAKLRNRYLYKIFANLNAGGTKLTPQELRNGIYRCKFYEMLSQLDEKNEKWNELFGTESDNSRNMERLLRCCAFKYYIKFKNNEFKFVIENYKNMNKLLNDFSEAAVNFNDDEINEYKLAIENFMNLLKEKIGKKVLQQTLLESLFTVTNKTNFKLDITEDLCKTILDNKDYKDTVRTGNATKNAIETKLQVVYDEICKYSK